MSKKIGYLVWFDGEDDSSELHGVYGDEDEARTSRDKSEKENARRAHWAGMTRMEPVEIIGEPVDPPAGKIWHVNDEIWVDIPPDDEDESEAE